MKKDHSSQEVFVGKYNIHDGKEIRMKITTDANWPEDEKWEYFVDYEIDKDRKLLPLKTHDGLDYYSFYYEPTGIKKNCDGSENKKSKKEVVVLVQGGTGSYKDKPDDDGPMGIETASFLKSQGYIVLMANVRGKKKLSNEFRLSGIGQMYNHGVKDIITALDGLSDQFDIDKSNIKIMGCSRGGHFAALFATYLSKYTKEYKVIKTIVSSGTLNAVKGALNYYEKLPSNFSKMTMEEINQSIILDLNDNDWMGGALCPERPHGIYTDDEWKKILEFDQYRGKGYLELYPNPDQKVCKYSTYQRNSPAHNVAGLQGDLLALAGYDEYGLTDTLAPLEFKSLDKSKNITAVLHPFDHCIAPRKKEGWKFKVKIFSDFLNGCEEKISNEKIKGLKEKIGKTYSCLEEYFKNERKGLDEIKLDNKNFLRVDELEKILTTYEKDFLKCKERDSQRCLWQSYVNYSALLESYNKTTRYQAEWKSSNKLLDCIQE